MVEKCVPMGVPNERFLFEKNINNNGLSDLFLFTLRKANKLCDLTKTRACRGFFSLIQNACLPCVMSITIRF